MTKIPRSNLFFCALITFLIFLVYSNSFFNSFHFDDFHVIEKNPYIKNPDHFLKFFWSPHMGSGLYRETSGYRPLFVVSFALNYSLGGLDVFGYHVLNWFLHISCAIFVYFITLFFLSEGAGLGGSGAGKNQFTALLAALLFGLHPIQTESVTYICGRSSSLTAFFFLAAFLAFAHYGRRSKPYLLLLSSLSYLLALMVKETAITFPVILVLFNLLFPMGRSWQRRFFSFAPFVLITAGYLLLRIHFFGNLQYSAHPIRPLYDHMLTQIPAWVYYIGTLLLPLNLTIDYHFPVFHSFWQPQVLQSLALLIALIAILWRIARRYPPVGFFALWFAVNLMPTNSLIPLEDIIADRWLYLPSVGYAVIIALAIRWIYQSWIHGRSRASKWVFFFGCFLVIEMYGFGTLLRNFTWTTPWTLWEDAVEKSPNKARTHTALGLALKDALRLKEAEQEFQTAIRIDPADGRAYLNLGLLYDGQGKIDEAIQVTQKAIQLTPRLADVGYNNLGLYYLKKGKTKEGLAALQKAIEIRPINSSPYFNLANYHYGQGNIDQAISDMEKAVRLEPELFIAHEALSRWYAEKGWKDKSQEAYKQYLRYRPSRLGPSGAKNS